MITSAQMRAGRALIRWSADELATQSKLGIATIRRAEAVDGPLPITEANSEAVQRALEAAGVEFIPEGEAGPGVRLRSRTETHDELTRRIDAIREHLAAHDSDAPASPRRGMQLLEHARKQNIVTKLKNRRTKLKDGKA